MNSLKTLIALFLFSTPSLLFAVEIENNSGGVSQIIAGSNVTLAPANGKGAVTVSVSVAAGVAPGASYYYQIESTGNAINQSKSTATYAAISAASITVTGSGPSVVFVSSGITFRIGSTTTFEIGGNGNIYQNGALFSGGGSANTNPLTFTADNSTMASAAKVWKHLDPQSAKLSTGTNSFGASIVSISTVGNCARFGASVSNTVEWTGKMGNDYDGGEIVLDFDHFAESAVVAGNINWTAAISTATTGTAYQVGTSSLVTVSPAAFESVRTRITINNRVGLAAGKSFRLKLERDKSGSDTLTSSATINAAMLRNKW